MVIGHTGILKQNILEIPKIGTLNSHPGILPYYKGLTVYIGHVSIRLL